MVAVQTTRTSRTAFSRCDERSTSSIEKQIMDHEADQADATIAVKVERALWNIDVLLLRNMDYEEINVNVRDGVVFMSGHVSSITNQKRAEDASRTIPGVLDVESALVLDENILRDLAGALGKIEHMHGVKFFTAARNGVVGLHGEVSSATVRALAEKSAASIPGVRGVINYLRSPEVDLHIEDQRFFQPSIGERIYLSDGLYGIIQSVIINPNNRRVVAMIVRGRYPKTQQEDPRFLMVGETRTPERLIVIPVSAIRILTNSSGFLNIDSADAARYSDFDLSRFIAPGKDWTPPFPYCLGEVFFPKEDSR